ncbi:hypothetical protein HZH66_000290 [Vespula vulgaris]|uniref:Uncharacterized protein n=1 Tax=Vespula vulgaris TaxID=7454 RepID=A0A834NKQ3_VESVU|nr:hypothetical protein HZH66_000290 [Vespula vulgaris]
MGTWIVPIEEKKERKKKDKKINKKEKDEDVTDDKNKFSFGKSGSTIKKGSPSRSPPLFLMTGFKKNLGPVGLWVEAPSKDAFNNTISKTSLMGKSRMNDESKQKQQ